MLFKGFKSFTFFQSKQKAQSDQIDYQVQSVATEKWINYTRRN